MTPAAARFLAAYVRGGRGDFTIEETRVEVAGESQETSLYLPPGRASGPGRAFRGLDQQARAEARRGRRDAGAEC